MFVGLLKKVGRGLQRVQLWMQTAWGGGNLNSTHPSIAYTIHFHQVGKKETAASQADKSSPEGTEQIAPVDGSVSIANESLARSRGQSLPAEALVPPAQNTLSDPFVPVEVMESLSPAVQRIFIEGFNLELLASSESLLPADGITLAAYLDYLTASGQPEAAVELVCMLVPELKSGSYPAEVPKPLRLSRKHSWNRRNAVSRAVPLGPLFFTAALKAAVKAGRTGLAERTWRLAKAGEGSSWNGRYNVRPWVLPCAAYTLMLQCYAREARKAYRQMQNPMLAVVLRRSARMPFGWGARSFTRRRRARHGADLLEIIRDMGAYILRSRKISEEVYRARLTQYLDEGRPMLDRQTTQIPVADERFYNAALDLYGRVPGSYYPTKKRLSPRRLRRLERRQLDLFMQRGSLRFPQDSKLTSVLSSMRESGYEIPLVYRHMLIGINLPPETPRPNRFRGCGYDRRVGTAGTARLLTAKKRGLPVRRSLKVGRATAS